MLLLLLLESLSSGLSLLKFACDHDGKDSSLKYLAFSQHTGDWVFGADTSQPFNFQKGFRKQDILMKVRFIPSLRTPDQTMHSPSNLVQQSPLPQNA